MNEDFPRILSLLRKERHISQKQAASDLCVAQALLSHYEKGKRECGLDFLVRAANYYNVSTDYLLGRSPVSSGSMLTESDIPENAAKEKASRETGSLSISLSKKLIANSLQIIYTLLDKVKCTKLTSEITNMLTATVYRCFRLVFSTNAKNDRNIFTVPEECAYNNASAFTTISEGKAFTAIKEINPDEAPEISTATLEADFQTQATALLNLIKNCENSMKKLD